MSRLVLRHGPLGRLASLVAVAGLVAAACGTGSTATSAPPAATTQPSQTQASGEPAASPSAALEAELVINNCGGLYGDAIQTAFVIPFENETGVQVTYDSDCDDQDTRLRAQQEAGQVQWDVIGGNPAPAYKSLFADGALVALDHAALGSADAGITEESIQEWGLGQNYEAVVLGYDQTAFPGKQVTVASFFDPVGFPGDRAILGAQFEAWNPISQALVADGVSPDALTPLDYDRAFAKLDTIKSSIKVYYESGSQMQQLMTDKQAVMCLCTDGRMLQVNKVNPEIHLSFDGALRTPIYWAIPANAAHPNAAMAFLKSSLNTGAQAAFTSIIGYSGVSVESYKLLPPDRQSQVLANPANFDLTFEYTEEQIAWFAENESDIADRYAAWLSQ